jgi:hypothetical protein
MLVVLFASRLSAVIRVSLHSVITVLILQIYVLSTDLSGIWTQPDLAWEPCPWFYHPTFNIRLLYIAQLVCDPPLFESCLDFKKYL